MRDVKKKKTRTINGKAHGQEVNHGRSSTVSQKVLLSHLSLCPKKSGPASRIFLALARPCLCEPAEPQPNPNRRIRDGEPPSAFGGQRMASEEEECNGGMRRMETASDNCPKRITNYPPPIAIWSLSVFFCPCFQTRPKLRRLELK